MRQLPCFTSIFLTVFVIGTQSEPCSEYGCPHPPRHEPFVPALPGHTPRCAKPGQTFCESLDHYPQQLIRFLIDKWNFDYNTLLIDESRDEFNAYRKEPEYHGGYEYRRPEVPQLFPQPLPFLPPQYPYGPPSQIYGSPTNSTHQQGYNYPAPPRSANNPFIQQAQGVSHQLPQIQPHQPNPFLYSHAQTLDPLGQNHGWWANRYTRSNGKGGVLRKRVSRSLRKNPLLDFANSKRSRSKRQTNSSSQAIPLCLTNSQYIMPKAALNNRGNWMYVVNLQEQGEKYTQLVRSETCASSTCNGLCSLPAGYTSRCQQQYVQKRLVALEGSGDRLYTDVFWFPHCCTCQVTLVGN